MDSGPRPGSEAGLASGGPGECAIMRSMRLDGAPVLITGASRGIGEAAALAFAVQGCRVALLGRDVKALEQVAARCHAVGGQGRAFVADVTDGQSLSAAVTAAAQWGGGVRIAVANAGLGVHLPALGAGQAARRVLEVNYLGAVETVNAVAPHLLASGEAALVAVASLSALIPYRGGGPYGASKAALVTYLRCLRLELAGTGVRVSWVCPGPVRTEMIVRGVPHAKLPRLARALVPVLPPRAVARRLVELARRGSGQYVMPAQAAFFAALARWMPRLAERLEVLTGAGEC